MKVECKIATPNSNNKCKTIKYITPKPCPDLHASSLAATARDVTDLTASALLSVISHCFPPDLCILASYHGRIAATPPPPPPPPPPPHSSIILALYPPRQTLDHITSRIHLRSFSYFVWLKHNIIRLLTLYATTSFAIVLDYKTKI